MTQRFDATELERLFVVLREEGFRIVGPRVRDRAIVYDQIESSRELPRGWTDVQEKGHYRLERRDDQAYFGFNAGPQSWKQFLFVPREKLWSSQRSARGVEVEAADPRAERTAFLGVRACEMAAIRIQDRVFIQGEEKDAPYQARRNAVFIIAVNCTEAGNTCFCVSMGTGPRVPGGVDVSLTEIIDAGGHYFLCDAGTADGERILERLGTTRAASSEIEAQERGIENAAASMGRSLKTAGIRDLLYGTLNHGRWNEVAERCLSCANCTLVCPTCFCSNVEDMTDLSGDHAERWRRWDSCFTLDHSYLHGGNVHASVKSRYRQWLTHKLGSWIDQFGTSGCVGCGRCIAWCPVGIDITEEMAALRIPETGSGP